VNRGRLLTAGGAGGGCTSSSPLTMSDLTVMDCVRTTCQDRQQQAGAAVSVVRQVQSIMTFCCCFATCQVSRCEIGQAHPADPPLCSWEVGGGLWTQNSCRQVPAQTQLRQPYCCAAHLDAFWNDAGIAGTATAGGQGPWGWSRPWCDWAGCYWAWSWFRGWLGHHWGSTRPGRFPASQHSSTCTPCVLTPDKLIPGQVLAPLLR
jgi:hypothetical protein